MSSPDYRRWSRRIQRRSPSSSPLDNVVLSGRSSPGHEISNDLLILCFFITDAELASEEQEEADDGTAEAGWKIQFFVGFHIFKIKNEWF